MYQFFFKETYQKYAKNIPKNISINIFKIYHTSLYAIAILNY